VDRRELRRERQILQDVLREMRLAAGLRQQDLAERLGVPQSFVSKYESGERRLDVLELRRVCFALGITLHDFTVRLEDVFDRGPKTG
jgi:transcriptional regulator with XRE-family HTH domain